MNDWEARQWRRDALSAGVDQANKAMRLRRFKESVSTRSSLFIAGGWGGVKDWLRWRQQQIETFIDVTGRSVCEPGHCFSCRGWGLSEGGLGEGWCVDCQGTGRTTPGGGY